jgi:hypothetical protein
VDERERPSRAGLEPLGRAFPSVGVAGFAMAVLATLAAVLAGPGVRLEWWHFRTGFVILRWATYGAMASGFLCLIGLAATWRLFPRKPFLLALAGLLLSLLALGTPAYWGLRAQRVPPIHDVTTDMENPPRFEAIVPLREDAPNPVEYGGPEVAAMQRAAYPDIEPAFLDVPPEAAFMRALDTVGTFGWDLADADEAEGRIEATDTTFWFGFKDDIVVRVTPADGGSRVDVRSSSRVGLSDAGTNARRIRNFIRELERRG